MNRTNLTAIGSLALLATGIALAAYLAAPPPPRAPRRFLHVVSGFADGDRAWVDSSYTALPERLGLTPCGTLSWPETHGDWALSAACRLTEGYGPPCTHPAGVHGQYEGWTVAIDGVWPTPAESTVDDVTLHTPRGDGFTLVSDGEGWCAMPWTGTAHTMNRPPHRRIDVQRTRRAHSGGVLLTWIAVER